MLRRKLLLLLGGLTVMLLATALAALWPLQQIFSRLDHLNTEARQIMNQASDLNRAIGGIEVELYQLQTDRKVELDGLIEQAELLHQVIAAVGEHYASQESELAPLYQRLKRQERELRQHVARLATVQDPGLARTHKATTLRAAAELRTDILEASRIMQTHVQEEQADLTRHFRWLVIGMALVFLIVIDAAVLLLLRTTSMVLRPIDRLVEASRRLARGEFTHRVIVQQQDEFDELAAAFNHLAEQLEQQEQRRVETLRQVALTLNHELNNAMAVIEMQLQMLQRENSKDPRFEPRLQQIHRSLQRMTRVVESLKHVQRIVLTDYSDGLKMLDLERSTENLTDPLRHN